MKKLLLLLCSCSLLFAKSDFNQYANQNRELMISPVSVSMGGADLALNSGIGFSGSPSNLPFDSVNNLSLSYANYFQNTYSSSILSYSGPADSAGGISITGGYVYIPDIPDNRASTITENNTIVYQEDIKNCSDIFVRVGYGHRFGISKKWDIAAGVAANARRTRLIDYSGYGLGLDAGVKALHKKSGIAVVLQMDNITTHYTYWSEGYQESAYPHLRLGLGFERAFQYVYGRIRVGYASTDLLSNDGINSITSELDTNDQEVETVEYKKVYENPELLITDGKLGIEYVIMNRLALRFGVAQSKLNFGAGLQMFSNRAGVDFAYTMHQLAGTYQVSLMYRW